MGEIGCDNFPKTCQSGLHVPRQAKSLKQGIDQFQPEVEQGAVGSSKHPPMQPLDRRFKGQNIDIHK